MSRLAKYWPTFAMANKSFLDLILSHEIVSKYCAFPCVTGRAVDLVLA